jgi:dCMP deaminase|uniref:CMP/dCMP-type deaminase domain-containing protein n=1 Tax=viral metagenome TaxID=1070528 RepID=A0A6C0BJN5_9ZZZZ
MSKINDVQQLVDSWHKTPRIQWHEYFMSLCLLASSRSPCSRLHVGCVLVKNQRIISIGYNGFLPGVEHQSVIQMGSDGKEHEMATVHAEQNAISYGANTGLSIQNATAYVTHYPCLNCAKAMYASGIKQVYYHTDYHNDPLVTRICVGMQIVQI